MDQRSLDALGAAWMAAMRRADFEAAYRETDRVEHERRAVEARGALVWQPHHLTWNGAPLAGRDVAIWCSHGLGDTLQFVRFVPLVRDIARSVTLLVQPALVELFQGGREFGDVRNAWTERPPAGALEIEIMELAYAFRSTAETLPRNVPYLPRAAIERAAGSLPRLDPGAQLNVGLVWAASEWDKSRSVPLLALDGLSQPGVRFHSLQQGSDSHAWRESGLQLSPLHVHAAAIAAAAAAMLELDLILTVDSMAAHLAGALARPVWVMLQHEADWRWMSERSDSPWYPTMRLYRQSSAGDWGSLAEAIGSELTRLAHSAGGRFRAQAARP